MAGGSQASSYESSVAHCSVCMAAPAEPAGAAAEDIRKGITISTQRSGWTGSEE